MTDDRKAGIALIAGSLGGMLTMAVHPTAGPSLSSAEVAHLSAVSGAAHSIAILSLLLLFLGGCGISQRTSGIDRISFAAIVVYGLACVAILIAATVSGFIVPEIMKHMARDVPAAASQWRIVIDAIFQINQAFARIYSVAASISIILWSVAILLNGGLGHKLAIYGCVVAALTILGIGAGHLRLDVHGMALVGLGQVAWFIPAGYQLCSPPRAEIPSQ